MHSVIKKTALHARHLEMGAHMADFGGYEMPLWYSSGARSEHLAVLTAAGMFDTSHMALIRVRGENGRSFLQGLFSKDLDYCTGPKALPLAPGRCAYGVFCDVRGHVLDDALVYMLEKDHYFIVVNAGMGGIIKEHLSVFSEGQDVVIEDLTDRVGKVDVQGPFAGKILSAALKDVSALFAAMPYFSFKGDWTMDGSSASCLLKDDTPILLSRTGYTGEFGFEIFCALEDVNRVWSILSEAGKPFDLIPCGLAARDSLRTGALLPLSHQDIGDWPFVNHPWMFALPFTEDRKAFTKGFLGDESLMAAMETGFHTYAFLGKDLRKVAAGPDTDVWLGQEKIGRVLSCVTDMGMGIKNGSVYSIASTDRPEGFVIKGLVCGFVRVDRPLTPGIPLILDDGKRKIPVTLASDLRPARTARMALSAMLV
ncbi:aminomethyltransferase family protein [Desulfobotulus mexicanus]|uniref:Aminomethyl transferase family protein n=1 Tax=Desulfobotulus mexicanus TaxID=2586642 RepID=A0A5S5MD76_9BACT|nr:aminomethyltransferase family protein [Desulfobotulus mexicanus]TYT73609.1 aminomethyl transferase family protein [Desulfobotulus mexicanus]